MTANPAAGDLFGGSLALSIAGAVWVWLLALTLGAALLPAPNRLHDGSRLLVWPVVGVAVQTQVWLILGLFDQLWSPVVVGVAIGLTTVAGLLAGPRIARELRATLVTGRSAGAAGPGGPHWIRMVAWGSVTVFIALVLRFSLWPTVFYDDLVYHLGIPRQALLTGSWPATIQFSAPGKPRGSSCSSARRSVATATSAPCCPISPTGFRESRISTR